ncbi:polysaccharide biosynthesis/export family protein [Hyphomicrobium sp.]|uniref:polysaccharide biosynthesis/export family protein n=1 Tax=Hyphomicrobium sp. TaxID=82 RepID=UPI0025BDFD1D|nr:polysaccharide biosynthesis/export family protein [Hyphomicrobium sp.]MCC7251275.1 polysaccharide biosynthesis/export family protein [Hyphomicrobium sp.]
MAPWSGRARIVAAIAASTLFASVASASEYRLAPGDTIEFSTVATQDLRTRATVRLDGAVGLPLIGDVEVAGLTLGQLQAKLQDELATKVYRRRSDDGREIPLMVGPGEVVVTIAEYRPIYVNGDVSKPGEQPFRPGMTVRQAIALAGGYDIMHFRMENPFLEQADLHGDYESLWTEFAKQQAIVKRLEAELENAATLDRKALRDTPVAETLAARIVEIEDQQLAASNAVHHKNRSYLEDALKKEDSRIAILADQQRREKEGVDADISEYTRGKGLFDKQTLPITRVVDARRTILFSSTRYLQTIVEKGRAERGRDELQMKLDKLDDERRKGVLLELQEANVKLATTRAKLQAVGDKLVYTGLVRSQLVRGKGSDPEIIIHRKGGEPIAANQEHELLPGDVVDVALQKRMIVEDAPSAAPSASRRKADADAP